MTLISYSELREREIQDELRRDRRRMRREEKQMAIKDSGKEETIMHLLQFFGDLPIKAPHLCATPLGFNARDDALNWLKDHMAINVDDGDEDIQNKVWFDPEDDRIVIWEIIPNEPVKLVWHASGWHWQHDAADLPGGPLEQGKLPGDSESLYDRASCE